MNGQLVQDVGYDIRFSTLQDEAVLKSWILIPEVGRWFPPSTPEDVDLFVRNWIGFARYNCSLTATYQGEPVGIATLYLMPYLKVAHLCMLYIVVDPRFQRRGIGGSLIKNCKHLAKTRFRLESIHVEVYDHCPLIPLLEKYDFKKIIRQENFAHLDDGFHARVILEANL